ncbi:MAG: hypothetical protein OSB30_00380 [Candidatus Poseidoniaceae archaeon]|nr:hypothetical protein [Candidatus Poseidoniaceae archaeon]
MNADYDIVIDGSNLINHSEKGVTKLIPSRLIKAIRKVELLGYTPLTCIDRSTYNQAKKKKKPLEGSIEDFAKLIDEEGMRFMNRDDEMIDHALQRGALILTNDRFRKWKDGTEKTKLEIDWDLVDEKLVQWWFEDEFFMPELLKKSSQPSKIIGKAPINSVRRLANNNSNKNVQRKKRSMFIKVLDLIFDNNKKAQKPHKRAKKQHKNQTKSKPQASKKPQAKAQQKKAKPQQNKPKKNPQNQKPKQTKPQQKKAKPQAQKTASKEKKPNPQSKKSLQAKAPQKKPKPSSKKSNKSKQAKNTSSDIANFKSKILEILPDRKISISGLATIINKQMVAAGIEKNPTTEFLKQYKLPKGLKKAINTHMSDEVIITGTGTKFFIEKKSKADKKA